MTFPLDMAGLAPQPGLAKLHMVFKASPYAPDVPPQAVSLAPFFIDRPMNDQLRAYASAHGIYSAIVTAIPVAGMARV